MKPLPLAIILLLLAGPLMASTIHVPADQPTIQAGINAATDGDPILVADGTYTGDGNRDLDFQAKAITVRSENGPEVTIIDCQGTASAFVFWQSGSLACIVDSFTVTNGYGAESDRGGAITLYHGSASIRNCVFDGNASARYGGAIYCEGSSPSILNCVFAENSTGRTGGAIYCKDPDFRIRGKGKPPDCLATPVE